MNNFKITQDFENYKKLFLEENSKINLISKNDEQYLYEKHIYDSLAIKLFFDKQTALAATLLDIGTGGGFPAIPIAIEYPQIKVSAIDSITKKINSLKRLTDRLNLTNVELINDRVENLKGRKFDIITSRAVGKIDLILNYSNSLINSNGHIVLYKSKTAHEELENAKPLMNRLNLKLEDIIEYSLPTEENYIRYLVIIKK